MYRSIFLAASIAMSVCVLSTAAPQTAQAGGLCCGVCCVTCPDCRCKLTAEEVEVEKSCFEFECETICIPKVVFPWQSGKGCCFGLFGSKKSNCCDACDGLGCDSCCSSCPNNGAVLRKVKVLKSKKYKCPACEYTWSADDGMMGGNGCCDSGCCDSGCCEPSCGCGVPTCDGCCASNDSVSLPPAFNSLPAYEDADSKETGVVPVQSLETVMPVHAGN